jgi:uncharacterized protein (TIGR02270 family)
MNHIPHIIDQYAEGAAFLWLQRDRLASAPHVALRHLARFDERLEAYLDGLRIAGPHGVAACEAELRPRGGPALFPAFYFAVESADADAIDRIVALAPQTPDGWRPLGAALAWTEPELARPLARVLAHSSSPAARGAAGTAFAAHRVPDGPDTLLADPNPIPRARALLAAGQLGRTDLIPALAAALDDDDAGCRLGAAWSLSRMGDPRGLGLLRLCVEEAAPFAAHALPMLIRRMDSSGAATWMRGLSEQPRFARVVVRGAGLLGDPAHIPWLLRQIARPALGRLAGEAIAMITGADLVALKLDGARPEGFESGPNDDPADPNVDLDPDDDLPWPDAAALTRWWQANAARFPGGERRFLGLPATTQHLTTALREATQRQRAIAALELALLHPQQPLFDVRAPAQRQRAQLAAIGSG